MNTIQLGRSDLHVTPICLGTMTFGEQVDEPTSHAILSRAVERGINFIDTAEMYSVPPRAETFNLTEKIIGNWIKANPAARDKLVIATKVAGPSRGMPWVRNGSSNLTAEDIIAAAEGSLQRMNIETIDLYQIHWPVRHVPMFGGMYYDPKNENLGGSAIEEQLRAMDTLVKAGKVRAIGLSNETSYGVHEFVRLAEQHGLPRIATVQNNYGLLARTVENGLDETMHRLGVSLLPYSPLAFGLLTGKYDAEGLLGDNVSQDWRLRKFESTRKQRWGRPDALKAARRYNALAREYGFTPSQMALAFCYTKWQVASTIIGVRTLEQLDQNIDAWGTVLPEDLLKKIDEVRWEIRDPAV